MNRYRLILVTKPDGTKGLRHVTSLEAENYDIGYLNEKTDIQNDNQMTITTIEQRVGNVVLSLPHVAKKYPDGDPYGVTSNCD